MPIRLHNLHKVVIGVARVQVQWKFEFFSELKVLHEDFVLGVLVRALEAIVVEAALSDGHELPLIPLFLQHRPHLLEVGIQRLVFILRQLEWLKC